MEYNLQRFVKAQGTDYETALSEIKKGRKHSHWIWYVFPQFKEFAHSRIADYYGIEDRGEAEAYLKHPILEQRIREMSEALMLHKGKDVKDIIGELDAGKVRSCMTMFDNELHVSLYSSSTTDTESFDTTDVFIFLDEHILHDWKDTKNSIARYLSLLPI